MAVSLSAQSIEDGKGKMIGEYDQELVQLRLLCREQNLAGIEELFTEIDARWADANVQAYVYLLRAGSDEVANCEFDDRDRVRSLLERRATLALELSADTQIDVQLHLLVSYLRVEQKLSRLTVSEWCDESPPNSGSGSGKGWRNSSMRVGTRTMLRTK